VAGSCEHGNEASELDTTTDNVECTVAVTKKLFRNKMKYVELRFSRP
jgi:hypothetical protein